METHTVEQDAKYVRDTIESNIDAILAKRPGTKTGKQFSHYDLSTFAGNISANRIEKACDRLVQEGFLKSEVVDPEQDLKQYQVKEASEE